MSCSTNNSSSEKISEVKELFKKYEGFCIETNKQLDELRALGIDISKAKKGKSPIDIKIQKYLKNIENQKNDWVIMFALNKNYQAFTKLSNRLNLSFSKMIGDKDMIEKYQFEKDWLLPDGEGKHWELCLIKTY